MLFFLLLSTQEQKEHFPEVLVLSFAIFDERLNIIFRK